MGDVVVLAHVTGADGKKTVNRHYTEHMRTELCSM